MLYFVYKFGSLFVELEKWPPRNEVALDSTLDEFLNLPRYILEVVTTEEHNKRKISVVGRSGCGLSINMKKKKIVAISQHAVRW